MRHFTPTADKTQVSEHPTVSGEQQLQNTKATISSCIFSAWEERMVNESAARLITRHNLQYPNLLSSLPHVWPDHGVGISSALARVVQKVCLFGSVYAMGKLLVLF